jgi:AcrR family transcriptional regulator
MTALTMLNDEGYGNVSLRQIPAASDIALGTLSYHFPKIEDLVLYLLSDLHEGCENLLSAPEEGATFGDIVSIFAAAEENRQRYPFYFRDISHIIANSPEMMEETRRFEGILLDHIYRALLSLRDQGIVRPALRDSDLKSSGIRNGRRGDELIGMLLAPCGACG